MRTATIGTLKREGTPQWLYETLHRLIESQEQTQVGLAAITRGESPDSSGSPLVNNGLYFYKPGLPGGQIAFGATNAGGTLTLGSTANSTRGFIYLGRAQATMYDETNERIGINTIPLFRLHQKHTALETMQRWEGPASISVASITANGTTTITTAASFINVYVGMLVTGTGVPTNTAVLTWTDSTHVVLTNAVTTGSGLTFTFANVTDTLYVANDSQYDFALRSSAGIQIITSSGSAGAQTSAIRFVEQTAIGTTIRNFIEAQSSNQNIAITGNNGGDGNSIHTLFAYQYLGDWNGSALSQNTRVGINEDPFDFSGSTAANQPDSLVVSRRTSATAAVPTVAIEGTGTDPAIAVLAASTGSTPNKVLGAFSQTTIFIRHDGNIAWGTPTTNILLSGTTSGGSGQITLLNTHARTLFNFRSGVAAFSDALASCFVTFSNTTDDGFRTIIAGDGGNILARLGICATAVIIGNTTTGVLNVATGLLEVRNYSGTTGINLVLTPVASQTGRLLRANNNAGTEVAGLTAAGAYFLVAGAGVNKVYISDASGVGSWATETLLDAAIHSDTAAGTVVRGDVIVGNSTPKWARVAMGTSYQLLGTDGTDTKFLTPLMLVGQAYSPATPTPALAPSGDAYVFADNGANRVQPAMVRAEGRMQWLQNSLGWHRSVLIFPTDSLGTSVWGAALVSTVGTSMAITFPVIDLTQVSGTQQINMAYTGALASVQGNIRTTKLLFGPDSAAGLGGYYFIARFSPFMQINPGHTLMFVGLLNSVAAIGNTDPGSLTNCIGIGFNASLNNFFLLHNDGAGAAITVDLGSNYAFSVATTIQLELYCPPASTTIFYRVTDLNHTSVAPTTGSFSTDVPASGTALAFHCHINTGLTAGTTPSINLHRVYMESDF